jgi:hypothetical protein
MATQGSDAGHADSVSAAASEEEDALVVTKPDRLARSTADLLAIEVDLSQRGIGLVVLSMGGERLDTRNPTSKLMLTIVGGVATWERETMLERQREGIAKAKATGNTRDASGPSRSRRSRSGRCSQQGTSLRIPPGASGWRGAACIGCLRGRSAPRVRCRPRQRRGADGWCGEPNRAASFAPKTFGHHHWTAYRMGHGAILSERDSIISKSMS